MGQTPTVPSGSIVPVLPAGAKKKVSFMDAWHIKFSKCGNNVKYS